MNGLYESQRTMRAMRKAALQRGVIAILDVGSTKIGCLILRFDGLQRGEEGEGVGALAGQSGFRVIGSATTRSRGIEFGEIVSMPQACNQRRNLPMSGLITSLHVFPVGRLGPMGLRVR